MSFPPEAWSDDFSQVTAVVETRAADTGRLPCDSPLPSPSAAASLLFDDEHRYGYHNTPSSNACSASGSSSFDTLFASYQPLPSPVLPAPWSAMRDADSEPTGGSAYWQWPALAAPPAAQPHSSTAHSSSDSSTLSMAASPSYSAVTHSPDADSTLGSHSPASAWPSSPSTSTSPAVPPPSTDTDSSASACEFEQKPASVHAASIRAVPLRHSLTQASSGRKRSSLGVDAAGAPASTRRSHRQLDSNRRAKERAALQRLEQLTNRQRRKRREDSRGEEEEDEEEKVEAPTKRASDTRKREKLSVLEASVAHIERLQRLVERLTQAGDVKDRRVQEMAHHLRLAATNCAHIETRTASDAELSSFAHSAAEYVQYLDSQHALYSSLFVHSDLSLMLLDLRTSCVLDANSRFLQQTRFEREQVVGKRINGKGSRDAESEAAAAQYEIVKVRDRSAAGRQTAREQCQRSRTAMRGRRRAGQSSGDGSSGGEAEIDEEQLEDELPWIDSPPTRQYPSSLRCLIELSQGTRDSFRAPWRCLFALGELVEVESVCSIARRQTVVEADGRVWERPVSIVIANGWTDAVPIDIANDAWPSE